MSSRQIRNNQLSFENGQIVFGENFADLMQGYSSPVKFEFVNLRMIDQAIANRSEAHGHTEHYHDDYDPEESRMPVNHFDHALAFFERSLRRARPLIEEANRQRENSEEQERFARLRLLLNNPDLSQEEKFELEVLTTLCIGDEVLAESVNELSNRQMDLFKIMTLEEEDAIHKRVIKDGLIVNGKPVGSDTIQSEIKRQQDQS